MVREISLIVGVKKKKNEKIASLKVSIKVSSVVLENIWKINNVVFNKKIRIYKL